MKMINEAKEELVNTLLRNYEIREEQSVHMDTMREEELVRMAQNVIIVSSDDKSDSGRKEITSKAVTSFHKAYTFPAEHKSDNEETPLNMTHQGPFTPERRCD